MQMLDYQELRALLDDLVHSWPANRVHPALDAARADLRTHCRECGARLTIEQVEEDRDLCPTCFARLFW